MSKPFLSKDFLLHTELAGRLYHDHVAELPIIDYHCHLSPADINNNRKFTDITEAWLEGDHYKWRAMRTCGVDEIFITGNALAKEKFKKWAEVVPKTLRNPLYHWTHIELQRYFGINKLLDDKSANDTYQQTSGQLQSDDFSCLGLLKKMKVEVVCTTDDPTDNLVHHMQVNHKNEDLKMLPTFRPDKAYAFDNYKDYKSYLEKLETVSNISIQSLSDLLSVLSSRIDYFHSLGGRLADHGLANIPLNSHQHNPEKVFDNLLAGKRISTEEEETLRYHILIELGKIYHAKGWTQQYHLGAIRNNSERMMHELGPDTGFDSIGDFPQATSLAAFLNALDASAQLAKTIVYNLNPADNEVMATMIGNFNDGSTAGKMQWGSAWWFLDQKDGMEKQINTLSNMSMLSQFVGMLTDSRSFLSFPRHEYFRRILCDLLGKDVMNGELPYDIDLLGNLVQDICYQNAKKYFNF